MMFVAIVVLILLSNYVAVSTVSSNSKTLYFTILGMVGLLALLIGILG